MTDDYEQLLRLLRARRSVRSFAPEPVPAATIEAALEAARWAPSAGNRQAFRFLVVTSRPTIDALAGAVRAAVDALRARVRADLREEAAAYLQSFVHFAGAPVVVAATYRHRPGAGLLAAATGAGERADPAEDRRAALDAISSVAAALDHLLLAAHCLGLGACWMTGPLVAEAELRRLLGVPAGWELAALVPMGYPASVPPAPRRRDLDRLVVWWDGEDG